MSIKDLCNKHGLPWGVQFVNLCHLNDFATHKALAVTIAGQLENLDRTVAVLKLVKDHPDASSMNHTEAIIIAAKNKLLPEKP